jgi:hypothetical protein
MTASVDSALTAAMSTFRRPLKVRKEKSENWSALVGNEDQPSPSSETRRLRVGGRAVNNVVLIPDIDSDQIQLYVYLLWLRHL